MAEIYICEGQQPANMVYPKEILVASVLEARPYKMAKSTGTD